MKGYAVYCAVLWALLIYLNATGRSFFGTGGSAHKDRSARGVTYHK